MQPLVGFQPNGPDHVEAQRAVDLELPPGRTLRGKPGPKPASTRGYGLCAILGARATECQSPADHRGHRPRRCWPELRSATLRHPAFSSRPCTERPVEPLSREDVLLIARLTRVGLTDDEAERMRGQLTDILAHFQSLAGVDTGGVEPTGHSADTQTVMRNDDPGPSLPRADVLANAPGEEGGFFLVPRILD